MKPSILTGLALFLAAGLAQAAWHSSGMITVGQSIPDGNINGLTSTFDATGSGWEPLIAPDGNGDRIKVTLNISGGYNGDLYGYLVYGNGFTVLLNRPGVTSGNPFGYSDAGMTVVLRDSAATDIHWYGGGGVPSGPYQPDGRAIDPASPPAAFDSASRGTFASFHGLNPNGQWTLFLADLSYGETSTLVSWQLEVHAVPEPVTWALGIFGALAGGVQLARWRRR